MSKRTKFKNFGTYNSTKRADIMLERFQKHAPMELFIKARKPAGKYYTRYTIRGVVRKGSK
jgi:hypothetical protein